MIRTILIALLILIVSNIVFSFLSLIPGFPVPIIATLQSVFFVTYLYVNFDRLSAKQFAIDRYNKQNPDKKIKLDKAAKIALLKKYILTFIVLFFIMLGVNYYYYFKK